MQVEERPFPGGVTSEQGCRVGCACVSEGLKRPGGQRREQLVMLLNIKQNYFAVARISLKVYLNWNFS